MCRDEKYLLSFLGAPELQVLPSSLLLWAQIPLNVPGGRRHPLCQPLSNVARDGGALSSERIGRGVEVEPERSVRRWGEKKDDGWYMYAGWHDAW